MNVVRCESVSKRFGAVRALDNVSFTVNEGEIFGIFGPHGAGKSSLIHCILGIDAPTTGTIELFGHHPIKDRHELAPRLGMQPQQPCLLPRISVAETMRFFASLYHHTVPWDALLESLDLARVQRTKVHRLTPSQQQKISIALAFLHQPELLILDELGADIDTEDRKDIWDAINTMCDYGTTVVLASKSIPEIEHLCDQVGVLDKGKILATGSIPGLIRGCVGESAAFLSLDQPATQCPGLAELEGVTRIVPEGLSVTIYGQGGFVHRVLSHLAAHRVQVTHLATTEPKFDDVFINLTGRSIHKEPTPA